jgi:hypothetical protein
MRSARRRLCLFPLALLALACSEEAAEPAPAGSLKAYPAWAERLCENWARRDGSCDLAALSADYEECFRTKAAPEIARMRERNAGARATERAGARKTHLCLELRRWMMTEKGVERWRGRPMRAAPPS